MSSLTPVSSVTGWASVSALLAAPVLNSATVAVRRTRSPTLTVGARAGEDEDAVGGGGVAVARRVLQEEAVVGELGDHAAVVTVWPTSGLLLPLPWIAGIG